MKSENVGVMAASMRAFASSIEEATPDLVRRDRFLGMRMLWIAGSLRQFANEVEKDLVDPATLGFVVNMGADGRPERT